MKTTEKMEQSGVFGRMFEGFALLEVIHDASGTPDNYRFLYVNPAFERLAGRDSAALIGKTLRDVLPEPDPFWFETYGRIASTGEPERFERYSSLMKKYVGVSAYSPVKGQCAAIFLDISERKQMEESLRQTRQFLSSLLEATPLPIYVLDTNGCYSMVNRAWEKVTGVERGDAIGRSPHDTVPHAIAEHCLEAARQVMQTGESTTEEMASELEDGEHYLHTIRFPIQNSEGKVDAVGNITADLTAHKQAEKALKDSEAVLRSFFDSPGQHRGIVEIVGNDILNVSLNESAAGFMGGTKEFFTNKFASDLGMPDEEVEMWIGRYEESRRTGQPVRFEFHRQFRNKESWFVARVSYLGDHDRCPRFAYVITDIAERKKAEAERERLLRELQQALGEVKTLSGLLPICSSCKKIRDDGGSWSEIENFIQTRSHAHFSHGICPDCMKSLYPEITDLH